MSNSELLFQKVVYISGAARVAACKQTKDDTRQRFSEHLKKAKSKLSNDGFSEKVQSAHENPPDVVAKFNNFNNFRQA